MQLTKENIYSIARLARLKVSEQEIQPMCDKLSHILDWVELLKEVNTDQVEPMTSVHVESMPIREDVVNDGKIEKDILQNGPETQFDMFVVPKVVE